MKVIILALLVCAVLGFQCHTEFIKFTDWESCVDSTCENEGILGGSVFAQGDYIDNQTIGGAVYQGLWNHPSWLVQAELTPVNDMTILINDIMVEFRQTTNRILIIDSAGTNVSCEECFDNYGNQSLFEFYFTQLSELSNLSTLTLWINSIPILTGTFATLETCSLFDVSDGFTIVNSVLICAQLDSIGAAVRTTLIVTVIIGVMSFLVVFVIILMRQQMVDKTMEAPSTKRKEKYKDY